MATAGGPKIVTDGLVFGYDTNYGVADNVTGTRFYPGKAVDNEFYNSGPDGNILDYVGYGGTGTAQSGALDAFGTTDNIVYRKTGKLRFGPTGGDDIGTLYYGNTYTFSIYMRHVPGETQMSGGEFDIFDRADSRSYSGTLSSNMTYEWKRFSVTALHNNSSNYHFIDVGVYQGTGVFEWCCPQIELGTIASPFTNTERTSTQSLIDLKETTDIDVSNVSFGSTGQPEFDGSNDYIYIDEDILNVSSFTVEAIVNITSTGNNNKPIFTCGNLSSTGIWFFKHRSGLGNRLVMHGYDGVNPRVDITSTNAVPDAENAYVAVTFNGTSYQLYINGVADGNSVSDNAVAASNDNYIGRQSSSGTYLLGDVPVLKIYNKALTATEIKQNYNAYKNRFDI